MCFDCSVKLQLGRLDSTLRAEVVESDLALCLQESPQLGGASWHHVDQIAVDIINQLTSRFLGSVNVKTSSHFSPERAGLTLIIVNHRLANLAINEGGAP